MAAPVWVLSVDLQTKTATFQSGMSEAAKSARGAFTDIKSGSAEMGGAVGGNMFAARHSVMVLGEEFGTHLPRALTAFIAHLGPVGPALSAAFPFLAISLGAFLLVEHLQKLKEAGEQLTQDQLKFGTAAQNAFNTLDQHLLQSQIKADELRNDHLGALHHQLQIIDMQSMAELVHQFAEVAKAADVVFGELKSSWYEFGEGSRGAKHALDQFQAQYDSLLAKHDDGAASDLLHGTLESAKKVLEAQKEIAAVKPGQQSLSAHLPTKDVEAMNTLKKAGVSYTENEVKAQQALVDALNDQVKMEARIAEVSKQDKSNASATTAKAAAALRAEGARQAAEHSKKMGEDAIANERAQAAEALDAKAASVAERLSVDLRLSDEELRIQLTANGALIQALNRGGDDYNNQLKALQDKGVEIVAQHAGAVAVLVAKAEEAQNRENIAIMEAGERAKIEVTEQGSAARLAAIDAAIREEDAKNLGSTQHYRELLTQRVQAQREADSEASKQAAEAGKQAAENTLKMGELGLAAARAQQALADSGHRVTIQQRLAEEIQAANAEYAVKLQAMQQESAALDKGGKDYANKLKQIQNQELQLTRQHEDAVTQLQNQAVIERNQRILAASQRFNNEMAAGLTQVLMGHKFFAAMMGSIGNTIASGMMQTALQSVLANDSTKESDAAAAARKAYLAGMHFPFPANIVMGPLLGAAAFASVMAFQEGTDSVPGSGRGDKVPAMLEPGEGVVPGGVMDGLRNMARSGNMGGGATTHVHFRPTYNLQALDSTGMDRVLEEHGPKLQQHVEKVMRKLNK